MERYVDVDKAIESIRNGDGTPMQKLFAECCLLAVDAAEVAPVHHAYWKVVTVIKEDCACGSNRLMQYKVCSHCEQPMGVCGTDYCGHCGAIMDGFVLEGHSDPTGHDGPCGEPGMDAVTFAKREVAKIFEELDKLTYRYLNDADYAGGDLIYDIAELRKKYTEEKEL